MFLKLFHHNEILDQDACRKDIYESIRKLYPDFSYRYGSLKDFEILNAAFLDTWVLWIIVQLNMERWVFI